MANQLFQNPFRPGAGHRPPYLAGRKNEYLEFKKLLSQDTILENLVLTGLRGIGKTVLLDDLRPMAQLENWLWAGTDLSEAASLSEENLATRIITDIAIVTSSIVIPIGSRPSLGFARNDIEDEIRLDFGTLTAVFQRTPGLTSDKLKAVFDLALPAVKNLGKRGIVFAYDEAQNLSDHAPASQYPLSLLLDVFQSVQRKGYSCLLVLVGLPTLFPKLVAARTYAERMFRVVALNRLDEKDSRDAIETPIRDASCPVKFPSDAVDKIVAESGGYPYFIQFICKEVYDAWLAQAASGKPMTVPIAAITSKLDTDFFAGRWAKATDRERDLLTVVAALDVADEEFTIQEIVAHSQKMDVKKFSPANASQVLSRLIEAGLIYKGRHGEYFFAVPMMAGFIRRQTGT